MSLINFSSKTSIKELVFENEAKLETINLYQDIIAFRTDGTIITAIKYNLTALGYSLEEIQGQKHYMFVESSKGFAVVENEVKELAAQASDVTNQIYIKIESLQEISNKVRSPLYRINSDMNKF